MTKALATKSTPKSDTLPEVVDSLPTVAEPTLTLILASDRVRHNVEAKVASLSAEYGVLSAKADRQAETMAGEYLRLRRMFPAIEAVRTILGEDTPDLAGRSPEYKAAIGRVNEVARDEMVNALRRDGFTVKLAIANADNEMERIRKSVTRYIRIAVEDEAKAILRAEGRAAAATFILGHGFGFSGEVGKAGSGIITSKGWTLKDGQLQLPEGEKISEDGKGVVKINAQAPPVEQSDQTVPSETADKVEAERLGDGLLDPQAIVNEAIGMLNRAAGLIPGADLPLDVRNSLRAALLAATKNVAVVLVPASAKVPATK
jgi:hypothetical protein